MLKKWVSVVFTVAYTMIGTTALAYVDDAGVMDYFNYNNDQYLYDYFNNNDYRFYNKSQKADAYMVNCVLLVKQMFIEMNLIPDII